MKQMIELKKGSAWILCIGALVLTLILIFNQYYRAPTSNVNGESDKQNLQVSVFDKKSADTKPSNATVEKKMVAHSNGEYTVPAEMLNWFAARGNYSFYGPDHQDDYKNYDKLTLEKLAESGDIRAMHELASKQGSISAANGVLRKAVIYGSTQAILEIGSSIEVEADIGNKSAEERKGHELEMLAYYHAAYIRGDQTGDIMYRDALMRRYPLILSQEDIAYILKRAQELYDDFQLQRTAAGLDSFDNTVPESVIQHFNDMKAGLGHQ